jgi:hypothetical protein
MATKEWIFPVSSLNKAKDSIHHSLDHSDVPDFVNLKWENTDLHITINKGSTSTIVFEFELSPHKNEVFMKEKSRKIAFIHKPFTKEVETFIMGVLEKAGAQCSDLA